MPYDKPLTIVRKICPVCEKTFESPQYYNKTYCTFSCAQRAKHKRRKQQDVQVAGAHEVRQMDARWFAEVSNPSEQQLDMLAKFVTDGATDDKPIKITHLTNQWVPPADVDLVKQQKSSIYDQDVWLMVKHEKTVMELLNEL